MIKYIKKKIKERIQFSISQFPNFTLESRALGKSTGSSKFFIFSSPSFFQYSLFCIWNYLGTKQLRAHKQSRLVGNNASMSVNSNYWLTNSLQDLNSDSYKDIVFCLIKLMMHATIFHLEALEIE